MRELQGVVDYHPGDNDGMIAIEPKLDGWAGIARWVDGVPVLYTRNGIELPLPHIQREVALLMPEGFFFHGELTHHAGFEAMKSAIARKSEDIHFHVFDMVDDFMFFSTGNDPRNYIDRRFELIKHVGPAYADSDNHVHIMPSKRCWDSETADITAHHLEIGFEGSVVKRLDSPYSSGATGDWMRIKPVATADCSIIGVEQSKTDATRASSLIVVDDAGVTSKVHAGLTEDLLREALEHPARFIGKVMEAAFRGRYRSGRMRCAPSCACAQTRPHRSPPRRFWYENPG